MLQKKTKYFCLLILLFCVSCSPQISQYKVCESCYSEEEVLKTLKSYLINIENVDTNWEMKVEIYSFDNVYYLQYSPIFPDNDGYFMRGGCNLFGIIVRKRDCKILYFGKICENLYD